MAKGGNKRFTRAFILTVLAVAAFCVLVVSYGTSLPLRLFAPLEIDGPTVVDSDGNTTAIVVSESRRVIVLDGEDQLVGIINCETMSSPIDAVTDVCVSDDTVFAAGVKYETASDVIASNRIAAYDTSGVLLGLVYEAPGDGKTPTVISLSDSPQGTKAVISNWSAKDAADAGGRDVLAGFDMLGQTDSNGLEGISAMPMDAAWCAEDGGIVYLDSLGWLNDDIHMAPGNSEEAEAGQRSEAAEGTPAETATDAAGDAGASDAVDIQAQGGEGATLTDEEIEAAGNMKLEGTIPGHVFTSIDLAPGNVIYACDDETGALCTVSSKNSANASRDASTGATNGIAETRDVEVLLEGDGFDSVHVNGERVLLCERETNTVTFCDLNGKVQRSFSSVESSGGVTAHVILVLTCIIFLVGLLAYIATRRVRQNVRMGQLEGMGALFGCAAVVLAVGIAILAFSYSQYEEMIITRAQEVGLVADSLEQRAEKLTEHMENIGNRDTVRNDIGSAMRVFGGVMGLVDDAEMMVSAAEENGISLYYAVYGKDDKGVFCVVDNNYERIIGTSYKQRDEEDPLVRTFARPWQKDAMLYMGYTLRDETVYRLVAIPSKDGESVVGVIEVGMKLNSFSNAVGGSLAQRVIGLVVMMLVVYLGYVEIRACGGNIYRYMRRHRFKRAPNSGKELRESAETRAGNPGNLAPQTGCMGEVALLTRPFTFIVTLLASVDSVMTVLIARDLLARMGVGDASPLLALPSVMLGLGIIVGQALYGVLGARIGMRRLVGMWAVAMMLAAIFTALSVAYGGFWAYCGAKFLLAIPIGLLYVLGYSMQRTATNARDRAMASLAVKNTDTSAAAIGTVLGGYAAQMLGDEWVYVIVAFACVLLLLMAIYLMPRAVPLEKLCAAADAGEGAAADAGDAAGKSPSSVMRFCMSKRALALGLLVILPGTLAAGYASFLFPLFSVEAGLDKADINNIYVLGQIIVFLMIGALGKAEGHFGFQRVSTMGIASIAVVFLLFSFNTKLAWAVVVVALVGMGVKASYGWKGMWLDAAREAGVAPGPATGAMFTFYRLTLVVQPFVLAGLLSASDSLAVILLGLFCGLCSFLFWRSCRKRDGRG